MKQDSILVFSYYACMPGACQAEWLDDKVDSLVKSGYSVSLISASCARRYPARGVRHWRVPSVSVKDFLDELQRIRARGEWPRVQDLAMIPLVFTIGVAIDALQYVLTKGIGEGRWSWALPSSIAGLILAMWVRPSIVLSTGGPASAHLSGIAVARLTGTPLVVELQDPLSGGDIGRNQQARGWLYRVERLIVSWADKVAYVTRGAAEFAKEQFKSQKIVAIYPGAKDFAIAKSGMRTASSRFRLVHLGSLYATRSFSSIIAAIDSLIASGKLKPDDIELINLGHVAPDIRKEVVRKPYATILPPVSREEALQFAADCDVTLLIQNSDERSRVTIPYKTYDYLNLNTCLVALLNSEELTRLVEECGHVAVHVTDVDGIAAHLYKLFEGRGVARGSRVRIDAVHQAKELVDCPGTESADVTKGKEHG